MPPWRTGHCWADSFNAGRLQFWASCCRDPTCWVREEQPRREDAVVLAACTDVLGFGFACVSVP